MQVLVYGDSLSWGIVPGTRQRLAERWPLRLEAALRDRGVRVIEDCLNGRRTVFEDPYKPGRDVDGVHLDADQARGPGRRAHGRRLEAALLERQLNGGLRGIREAPMIPAASRSPMGKGAPPMTPKSPKTREFYLNLPVRDLPRAKSFFAELGFSFEPRFTSEQGACMIVNDRTWVMLLTEPFFRTFTRRAICDTATHVEGLFCFSAPSREAVDALADKALSLGATEAREPLEYGNMYGRCIHDLDGHQWEILWTEALEG